MLFQNPLTLSFNSELLFLLPLCAAVAVVYKTVRTDDLHHLLREILALIGYMVVGLVVLCVGLWLIHSYWP